MIFLSHSWKNKSAARKIVEALATEGLPCWLDEQQLEDGAELRASLRLAISQSDVYLYLVSTAANESTWVQDELQFAIGLEHEQKLRVVPVRLADNKDALPAILSGRVCRSLDPTSGGAARLAHNLTEIDGHNHILATCRLSATARLEEHRLVHTLAQARKFSADREIHVLLLDSDYEALDDLYWKVAEVRFPLVKGTPKELADITQIIAGIHNQSRAIIKESRSICRRFLAVTDADQHQRYFDAGHERAIRLLLHRLQWNSTYLRYLRDSSEEFGQTFLNKRKLPEPFDGHRCDFLSSGRELGSIKVPKYGHPFPADTKNLVPWGLISPFGDIFEDDVGVAVGEILALRFLNQSLPSIEMPAPDSLTYGLS
jgi:TIR domain